MPTAPRSTIRLAEAARAEAHRARELLRAPGHRPPYLVSHLIRDETRYRLQASFGSLLVDERARTRRCFTDVRVGSYRSDQLLEGGLFDNSTQTESYGHHALPIAEPLDGVLHGLWKLTESRYRDAVGSLLDKRAGALNFRNPNRSLVAFQRVAPLEHRVVERFPEIDVEGWARYVQRASTIGKRHPRVTTCTVGLDVRHQTRLFVSSEGALAIEQRPYWMLECDLGLVAEDGEQVPWLLTRFVTDPSELPGLAELQREMRRTFRLLERIAAAPVVRAYAGPVWLDPKPAGLLVHEALGHRLEGNRLLAQGEGQTFRDALGAHLLPDFLSLHDDPRLSRWGDRSLVGHYAFDDEGVPAAAAQLVTGGRIDGFLTTRVGAIPRHRTNGHARNESFQRPMSRMGVTVLEARDGASDGEMKARLIREVRERGLPFGIHVLDADAGETATSAYDFQAFLGEIKAATRVYPDGTEELIRGVSFVGTPLNAVRGILAAGDRPEIDNAYCGAESGAVPVSTISPSLLVGDLELQATSRPAITAYTYPMPWEPR